MSGSLQASIPIVPDITNSAHWSIGGDGDPGHWASGIGMRKAFRVRGFSWFKNNIEGSISALVSEIGQLKTELARRPDLLALGLPWKENFAGAQMFAAAAGNPLRFDKAAKALLVCEIVARNRGVTADVLYGVMRIEPAVFTILNFDESYVNLAEAYKPQLLTAMSNAFAQPVKVFLRMMEGQTVSYRLAWKVQRYLEQNVPGRPPGRIVIGIQRNNRVACADEIIEGPSDPEVPVQRPRNGGGDLAASQPPPSSPDEPIPAPALRAADPGPTSDPPDA